MNSGIFKIANTITSVIPILMFVILGGFFGYRLLVKKGIIKFKPKDESGTDVTGAKERPIDDFNLIGSFKENYIVTDNNRSYTCGFKCFGIALDKLTETEQYLIAESHVGFYSMITWNMQLYIQSRQMDIQSNLEFIEQTYKATKAELDKCIESRKVIQEIIDNAPSRRGEYQIELNKIDQSIRCYTSMIRGKEEELSYAKKVASPDSPPQFDVHVLFTYKHDDSNFTTPLTDEEIFEKAKLFLEPKVGSSMGALQRCQVETKLLDPKGICEIVYRAYNLSDADITPFDDVLKSSAFDLISSSDYFFRNVVLEKEPMFAGGEA